MALGRVCLIGGAAWVVRPHAAAGTAKAAADGGRWWTPSTRMPTSMDGACGARGAGARPPAARSHPAHRRPLPVRRHLGAGRSRADLRTAGARAMSESQIDRCAPAAWPAPPRRSSTPSISTARCSRGRSLRRGAAALVLHADRSRRTARCRRCARRSSAGRCGSSRPGCPGRRTSRCRRSSGSRTCSTRSRTGRSTFGAAKRGRDPGLYYLRVFGDPEPKAPWSWRFGGHHVSINHSIVDGEVVASTPCFLGADPAASPLLGPHLLRPLGGAEDLGSRARPVLDDGQRARPFCRRSRRSTS